MLFIKKEKTGEKLIPVLPKNYRSIAIYIIENIELPSVLIDKKEITDYSEQGKLTQKSMKECIDFEIVSDKEKVLGFHDHPNEMWFSKKYENLALYCEKEGWLKVESTGS